MNSPNLLIIGSMKSGTSTLHNHLGFHPDIYMALEKEPSYFAHVDSESERRALYDALFADVTTERYAGESSTNYTKYPEYSQEPERIAKQNPDMRLIYIMRDPVERSISHFRHLARAQQTTAGLYDSIVADSAYIDVSNYAMQLGRYFTLFDRRNMYALTLEEYTEQPQEVMNGLYSWLEIDAIESARSSNIHENKTQPIVLDRRKAGRLYALFSNPQVRKLARLPGLVRIRDRVKRRYGVSTELTNDEIARTIEYLRPIQRAQVDELTSMLGRTFPMWTTLYGR